MPSKDDVVVIAPGLEQRTSKTGKERYTIKVSAEPVYVNLSPKELGKDVAIAIANHLKERVKGITAAAAPATIKARKVAAKAFALGKPWAMKRYAGGRTAAAPPNQSDRAFNDSGRFANGITATGGDNSWRVNVPANRLSGDASSVQRIWTKLVELVPEFADAALLFQNNNILAARKRTLERMVKKGEMQSSTNVLRLIDTAVRIFSQIDSLLAA